MDLIVKSARRRHHADLVDIGIAEGRIQRIEPRLTERATREIDAGGRLTTPSFVPPHIHLDKALTADRACENPTNVFEESIAIMCDVKRAYTVDDVADRATPVIDWLVGHGVTFIRSYVDVDSIVGLTALEGVRDREPRRRGITRVKELLAAGVNVAYGQDVIQDSFIPVFGTGDPLQVGRRPISADAD
jgi:cytosine deaminase